MTTYISVEEREVLQPIIDRAILRSDTPAQAARLLAFEMPWMVRLDWDAYFVCRKKELHEGLSEYYLRAGDDVRMECECGRVTNVFYRLDLDGELSFLSCDLCAFRHLVYEGGSIPERVTRDDLLRQRGDS